MNDENAIDQLRTQAINLLKSDNTSDEVKSLLRELNHYCNELEQRNKDLTCSMNDYNVSHSEYVDLFDDAPVWYVVIDEDHRIHKLNRSFMDEFIPAARREFSFEGSSFDEFLYPESRQLFNLYCRILHKPGLKVPLDIKLYDRFGMPRNVTLMTGRIPEGATLYKLAIVDVTKQKRRESQCNLAKETAIENDRQKSLFLADVCRELRSSMTTVVGFCELATESNITPEKRQKYINSIQLAGKVLMTMMDELQDLSLLESGRLPLTFQNVDIARLCADTVEIAQSMTRSRDVRVESEISDDIPILWADLVRLRQIISTVLNHAVGNATEGTVLLRGRFVSTDSISGILILNFFGHNVFSGESDLKFVNQGVLVSENHMRGLRCTGQIVKALHGKMFWLHPLDSLRIELPLQISRDISEATDDVEKTEVKGNFRTCLLVDDEMMNLKILEEILKNLGFVPTLVHSAKEALNLLAEKHFDFIMTDLWMPNMNGEELAKLIRQKPNYVDVPIYAVTADVECDRNFDMKIFEKTIIKPISIEKVKNLFT